MVLYPALPLYFDRVAAATSSVNRLNHLWIRAPGASAQNSSTSIALEGASSCRGADQNGIAFPDP